MVVYILVSYFKDRLTTHIYLLLGCMMPLWLNLDGKNYFDMTLCMSGVTILGVGDSMASWVGKTFGKVLWPATSKSLIGTCAAIFSVLLVLFPFTRLCLSTIVSTSLIAYIEAGTKQIDNLILPLYFFSSIIIYSTTL